MSKIMIWSGYHAAQKAPHHQERTMKRGKAQKKLKRAAKHCSRQLKRRGGSFQACIKSYFRKH